MPALKILNYHRAFSSKHSFNDNFDKLSYIITCILFVFCLSVSATQTYYRNKYSCYSKNFLEDNDADNAKFISAYCWTKGTYVILKNETFPQIRSEWQKLADREIITYQHWFMIIFGLQSFLIYLPQLFWTMIFIKNRNYKYVRFAMKSLSNLEKNSVAAFVKIACSLNKGIQFQRESLSIPKKIRDRFSYIPFSKSCGTFICNWYLIVKILFTFNPIFNLYILKWLFGQKSDGVLNFYKTLFLSVWNSEDFYYTKYFPLMTVCKVDLIVLGQTVNNYLTFCIHPENLFNRYFVTIIAIWLMFLTIVTFIGLLTFFNNILFFSIRRTLIKRILRNKEIRFSHDKELLNKFVGDYLKQDGAFIIIIIKRLYGELVVTELLTALFDEFKTNE